MRLDHTYHVSEHEGDQLSGSVRTTHTNKCYEDSGDITQKFKSMSGKSVTGNVFKQSVYNTILYINTQRVYKIINVD
jgi:hypothetical protein